jgi:phospholipid transport system substrate-binding protein
MLSQCREGFDLTRSLGDDRDDTREVTSMLARSAYVGPLLAWLIIAIMDVPVAGAQGPGSAMEAVRQTSEAVIRLLSDESFKKPGRAEERRQRLVQIIGERFSYEEMSKRTLGGQWNKLSPPQRQEFIDLFKGLLAKTYVDRIEGYAKEQVQYVHERLEADFAEVRTRIVSAKGALPLDFRLVDQAGDWRVYDIVVDGISLVNNYRGQFTRILNQSSYPQLMAKLKERSERED